MADNTRDDMDFEIKSPDEKQKAGTELNVPLEPRRVREAPKGRRIGTPQLIDVEETTAPPKASSEPMPVKMKSAPARRIPESGRGEPTLRQPEPPRGDRAAETRRTAQSGMAEPRLAQPRRQEPRPIDRRPSQPQPIQQRQHEQRPIRTRPPEPEPVRIKSDPYRGQPREPQAPKDESRGGRRPLPVWLVIIIDILLTGAALCVFAYFHHVREVPVDPGQIVELPKPTVTATAEPPAATASIAPTMTPEPVDQGDFGAAFPHVFIEEGGEAIVTDTLYRSHDVSIEIERVQTELEGDPVAYIVADIFVRNLENFKSGLAKGEFGQNVSDSVQNMAEENNAILAINGDYYSNRSKGTIVRNGQLYRDKDFDDILVMYYDGSMQTFSSDAFDLDTEAEKGVYQVWAFGPMLLDAGSQPMTEFDSAVKEENPRAAIGYYEPGHYCFVLVDGRQSGYSRGMDMKELSQLMYDLGCTVAYNLDGGASAKMYYNGDIISKPFSSRKVSDILCIVEATEEDAR